MSFVNNMLPRLLMVLSKPYFCCLNALYIYIFAVTRKISNYFSRLS